MEESYTSGDEGAGDECAGDEGAVVKNPRGESIPPRTNIDPIVKSLVDESKIDSGISGAASMHSFKMGKKLPPQSLFTLGRSARSSAKHETTSGYNESEEVGSEEDLGSDGYEDEREWDMETFDTRMLVQGAEDERYLESLPELERENILAGRFEKLKCEADMKKAIRENR